MSLSWISNRSMRVSPRARLVDDGAAEALRRKLEAQWSFVVTDMDRRTIAFTDRTVGQVTSWKWDFGDGKESTEQHPVHAYEKAGQYVVTLYVEGPAGKSRRAKVWDVTVK